MKVHKVVQLQLPVSVWRQLVDSILRDIPMVSYLGGGTIIKHGRFTSLDPAEVSSGAAAEMHRGAKNKNKQKNGNHRTRKTKDHGAHRILIFHNLIDQLVQGQHELKVPRRSHPELLAEVKAAGGAEAWLMTWPEFETVKARKIKKLTSKAQGGHYAQCKPKIENENRNSSPSTHAARHDRLKSATASRRIEADRIRAMRIILDSIHKGTCIPNTILSHPEIGKAISAAGSPTAWLKSQPDYLTEMQSWHKRSRRLSAPTPKSAPTSAPSIRPAESTTGKAEILAKGKLRIHIPEGFRAPADLHDVLLALGALPQRPPASQDKGKSGRKKFKEICADWIQCMDRAQRTAWRKLSKANQKQYLVSGKITLGDPPRVVRHPPETHAAVRNVRSLSDAPAEYIIESTNRKLQEGWNISDIDWSST